MTNLAHFAGYLALRCFIAIIQSLRMETCAVIAQKVAYLFNDVIKIRGKVVHDNLKHVYPSASDQELRNIARGMWEHLFLMICEIAHIPRKIHETNWRDFVNLTNSREINRRLLETRATVLVAGHYGNFELAGHLTGLYGYSAYTIARPLDNPYVHQWLSQFRSAHGQYILPKQGSADDVQRILDTGGTLTLLGDQYAGPKGCWTEFLGRPASCHKALALFTLLNDAPMVVTYCRRVGPMKFDLGCSGVFDPQIAPKGLSSVKALTAWYNKHLEDIVHTQPDQYWWVHRRWKGEPPKRKKKRRPPTPSDSPTGDSPASDLQKAA